jgi:hypothetical protein
MDLISYIINKIVGPHKIYSIRSSWFDSYHLIIIKFINALTKVFKGLPKMKGIYNQPNKE